MEAEIFPLIQVRAILRRSVVSTTNTLSTAPLPSAVQELTTALVEHDFRFSCQICVRRFYLRSAMGTRGRPAAFGRHMAQASGPPSTVHVCVGSRRGSSTQEACDSTRPATGTEPDISPGKQKGRRQARPQERKVLHFWLL
jgi:hypothetical protein